MDVEKRLANEIDMRRAEAKALALKNKTRAPNIYKTYAPAKTEWKIDIPFSPKGPSN